MPVDTPEQRATAARRLVGMLARKGYGAGIAYRVVREALAAHGAEHDELGAAEPSSTLRRHATRAACRPHRLSRRAVTRPRRARPRADAPRRSPLS